MHPDGGPPRALLIGHTTRDLTPHGPELGGTVAYAGLTLAALGWRVRVLTAANRDLDLNPLNRLEVHRVHAPQSTTFENIYRQDAREQFLRAHAGPITAGDLPQGWSRTDLLFLAPVADEIEPDLVRSVDFNLLGVTAQGWFREVRPDGSIELKPWQHVLSRIPHEAIVVLSVEDLGGSSAGAREIASQCRILALTDSARGADVFWDGQQVHIPAPAADEIDPTGAGDVFAAIFFYRLLLGDEPPAAARHANLHASASVNRVGLRAVPSVIEILDTGVVQA